MLKGNVAKTLYIALSGLVMVSLFQNCGQDLSDDFSINEARQEFALSFPFAYDLTVDEISYMSCIGPNVQLDPRYYTFKAGAFGADEGIRLRDNFRSFAPDFNSDQLASALNLSQRNSEAGVIMSVRSFENFQIPLSSSGSAGQSDTSVSRMMFDRDINLTLSQADIAQRLVALGTNERLNIIEGLPGLTGRSLDGAINIADSETLATNLRQRLQNNSFLSFTFAVSSENASTETVPGERARSPHSEAGLGSDAERSVFGLGYRVNFMQVDPTRGGSPTRAVAGISGVNLENQASLPESWSCNLDEKYIIVRPQDALRGYTNGYPIVRINRSAASFQLSAFPNRRQFTANCGASNCTDGTIQPGEKFIENVICPTLPDAIPNNAIEAAKWARIRNMLPHKDWYVYRGTDISSINGQYNCIVPKGPDNCYGDANANSNQFFVVQYLSDEDFPGFITKPSVETNCGAGTQKFCPHVASFCHKQ